VAGRDAVRNIGVCLLVGALGLLAATARPDDLAERRAEIDRERVSALVDLAGAAEARGAAALARRCWVRARRAGASAKRVEEAFARLADAIDDPRLSRRRREALEKKLERAGEETAAALAALARDLERAGRREEARAAARAAIRDDPDNADARETLGQTHVPGYGWAPVEAAREMKRGRFEFEGRWLPRREVDRRRREWAHAWEIESDHFHLRGNLPLERLVELRDVLEAFRARFVADWEDLLPLREDAGRHRVQVFAKRAEYEAHGAAEDPKFVRGVPGQYSHDLRRAAFFDVEVLRAQGQETSSLVELMLHECTHQLFSELVVTRPGNVDVGDTPSYWIHEGIAELYGMHTFAKGRLELDRRAIGGMLRTSWLRERASRMPRLAELDAMSKSAFQARDGEQRAVHYAQAGFLCLFLMDGEHRDAFRRILSEFYCGENRPGLLAARIEDLDRLDAAFRRSVRIGPGR
jgi:hypothetical protein